MGGHCIARVSNSCPIKYRALLYLWWKEKQSLECEDPPRLIPNSTSTQHPLRVPKEMPLGLSPVFIHLDFSFSTLAWAIELHPKSWIRRSAITQPVDHGTTFLEACDHHQEEPCALIFVYCILERANPLKFFFMKESCILT